MFYAGILHACGNHVVLALALVIATRAIPCRAQSPSHTTSHETPVPKEGDFQQSVLSLVGGFCIDCHNASDPTADIALDRYTTTQSILEDGATWERVFRVLNADAMPPHDHQPRPTTEERHAAIKWLEDRLFDFDCEEAPDPGRPTIRRLNRAEYNNTIRDLVGIDLRPADDFPADSVGHDFDNIGDVLTLSPMLMEKYVLAAEKVASAAIVPTTPSSPVTLRREAEQLGHEGGVNLGPHGFQVLYTRGQVFADFDLPVTGEYVLKANAAADQAGPELARMQFQLDDRELEVFEVQGHRKADVYQLRMRVTRGRHRFAAAFLNDYYRPLAKDPQQRDRNLGVRYLEMVGPADAGSLEYPDSHRRIVFTRPGVNESPERAARAVMRRFATQAYRRPVTESELDDLVKLVSLVVEEHGVTFEEGIQVAVQAVLVSPHFLYRVELDSNPASPEERVESDGTRRINGYELASRLSYFLWSSMPDDELYELARQDQLHQPATLEAQVQRMLADEKANALVANFAGQWLNLRLLDLAEPDPRKFASFDDQLRADMRRETELFFDTVIRENRSILDFLDADFTFLNRRLAHHYGRDDIESPSFTRASLVGTPRRGVLTHASVLTLTSNPASTSPVKRGKWILKNILGTPPPPPPDNVPSLEETTRAAPDLTMAQQLALHRSKPECVTCHQTMDPLGLGLENFDPIGRWRENDGELTIEPAGELPTGESFVGPRQLIEILNQRHRQDQFSRNLTERMLTYALGRGLQYHDKCVVDDITQQLEENEYRFHILINEIVKSDAFLKRRVEKNE